MDKQLIRIVTLIVTVGFFAVLLASFFVDMPESQQFGIMVGSLVSSISTILGFHYGSSESSRNKDEAMKEALKPPKSGK